MSTPSAQDIIATLGLQRHPEGGWYVQTFEDAARVDDRARSTAIYYLLERGAVSAWHRVDAVEVWHYYAGAPLELSMSQGTGAQVSVLGADLTAGQRPQLVVPQAAWQSARSMGDWTLVGCTVAPGFQFSGFELAAPGWAPSGD